MAMLNANKHISQRRVIHLSGQLFHIGFGNDNFDFFMLSMNRKAVVNICSEWCSPFVCIAVSCYQLLPGSIHNKLKSWHGFLHETLRFDQILEVVESFGLSGRLGTKCLRIHVHLCV